MILMRLVFVICVIVFCVAAHADDLPQDCSSDCIVYYGETLGESISGVKAYSNCNNTCVNPTPYFVSDTFTGIKWQCVEYARRWLLTNYDVVYGDVDIAADIWDLKEVGSPNKNIQKPFISIVNGDKQHGVQRGDLLIYSQEFHGTGHVAVILKVDEENQKLYLGEQNFDNNKWHGGFARDIPYIKRNQEIWVLDAYLIGWKRVVR
ncbi:MAG: CHAP domain-containing protein [Gammaproteobacteria bacterium]|nr:CHAP domain-containing protein [Gammaproteobacteria bacterium]